MIYFTCLSCFNNNSDLHSFTVLYQMMMDCSHSEERWNRGVFIGNPSVGKNDVIFFLIYCFFSICKQFLKCSPESFKSLLYLKNHRYDLMNKHFVLHVNYF